MAEETWFSWVGYAFGGMAKEALCALLASAAAEKGREEYVLEIGERCGVDLVFLEKITCHMAKLADEGAWTIWPGSRKCLRS